MSFSRYMPDGGPQGNQIWLETGINNHDVFLKLNGNDKKLPASIELRTRTGEGGWSYETGKALCRFSCRDVHGYYGRPFFETDFSPEDVLWRPAGRNDGIIVLQQTTKDQIILTLCGGNKCASAALQREKTQDTTSLPQIQVSYADFLGIQGVMDAMKRDWNNSGDQIKLWKDLTLSEALRKAPRDLLGSSHEQHASRFAQHIQEIHHSSE